MKFRGIDDVVKHEMTQSFKQLHDFQSVPGEYTVIIYSGTAKGCSLDPLPTSFVKDFIDVMLPSVLHNIVNLFDYKFLADIDKVITHLVNCNADGTLHYYIIQSTPECTLTC